MPKSLFSINLIALTLILTVNFLRAQEHAAYLIFNNKGEKVDYEQVKEKIC